MSNELLYATDGLQIAVERKTGDNAINYSSCTYVSVTLHLSLRTNTVIYSVNGRE